MFTPEALKSRLKEIAAADYPAPSEAEAPVILQALTGQIGTLDPELRDTLIYTTFARWISHQRLSAEQMRGLLATALDEQHLFYGVGEVDSDTVFTRSFSMLLLAILIYGHRAQPFLSAGEVHQVQGKILDYLEREKDFRGFVEEKGWAHAIAHASDAVDELAQCAELGREDLLAQLKTYCAIASEDRGVYTHAEDDRMSVGVTSIFKRQILSAADWTNWIEGLVQQAEAPRAVPQKFYCPINVKNLLRCTFFRLRRTGRAEPELERAAQALATEMEAAVERLSRF